MAKNSKPLLLSCFCTIASVGSSLVFYPCNAVVARWEEEPEGWKCLHSFVGLATFFGGLEFSSLVFGERLGLKPPLMSSTSSNRCRE